MSLGRWLQEQLFARRIVLVTGRLDDAAAALRALDANADKPIELHLDSADGTLAAAFVLIDTLDLLRAMLRVQCRKARWAARPSAWSRPPITAPPPGTHGSASPSRRGTPRGCLP